LGEKHTEFLRSVFAPAENGGGERQQLGVIEEEREEKAGSACGGNEAPVASSRASPIAGETKMADGAEILTGSGGIAAEKRVEERAKDEQMSAAEVVEFVKKRMLEAFPIKDADGIKRVESPMKCGEETKKVEEKKVKEFNSPPQPIIFACSAFHPPLTKLRHIDHMIQARKQNEDSLVNAGIVLPPLPQWVVSFFDFRFDFSDGRIDGRGSSCARSRKSRNPESASISSSSADLADLRTTDPGDQWCTDRFPG